MKIITRSILFCALLLAISCGGRKKAAVPVALQDRAFPQPTVPTAYTEPAERLDRGTVSELFGHRV